MKMKIFLGMALSLILALTGCKSTSIGIKEGTGTLGYDGVNYALNMSTIATSPINGGGYEHYVIFNNTGTGNLFSMNIEDNVSGNTITPGTYKIELSGDNVARFVVKGKNGDAVTGTMVVTKTGKNHRFSFSGTTTDENMEIKTVTLSYEGELNPKGNR